MGKTYTITNEEMNEIKEFRKGNKNKDIDKRLYAVQLRGEGMKNAEIADKLDTCPEVISHWVGRYKKEGIGGLLEHRKGGNNRIMSYEEEEEFLQQFYDDAVQGKVVTLREIKAAYEEKLDISSAHSARSTSCFIAIIGGKSNQDRSIRNVLPRRRSKPKIN